MNEFDDFTQKLPNNLGLVFANTTATYKFYWFISLLEIHQTQKSKTINVWDLVIRIVANAWYPVHYFKLSFGKSDSLYKAVIELQEITHLSIDASKNDVIKTLSDNINDGQILSILKVFTLNVPYRFLSPWIRYTSDSDVVLRSQQFENNCIYSIEGSDNKIICINPYWSDYLTFNYKILLDFCYLNLSIFIQTRNPNTPGIINKLIKPAQRESLLKQRNYWNKYLTQKSSIRCIFTNSEISISNYDLDHFIPWSFVSHNLMWNLLPVNSSINSAKSNKIPVLNEFLPQFSKLQQSSLKYMYDVEPNNPLLEDYLAFGASLSELVELDENDFLKLLYNIVSPLSQIALNMGFSQWTNI